MQYYNFEIVIEKEAEDEGYSAYSPSLPGCFSYGRTVEEAKGHVRDAIAQHLQSLLAHTSGPELIDFLARGDLRLLGPPSLGQA